MKPLGWAWPVCLAWRDFREEKKGQEAFKSHCRPSTPSHPPSLLHATWPLSSLSIRVRVCVCARVHARVCASVYLHPVPCKEKLVPGSASGGSWCYLVAVLWQPHAAKNQRQLFLEIPETANGKRWWPGFTLLLTSNKHSSTTPTPTMKRNLSDQLQLATLGDQHLSSYRPSSISSLHKCRNCFVKKKLKI